jgi:hypothetical protein
VPNVTVPHFTSKSVVVDGVELNVPRQSFCKAWLDGLTEEQLAIVHKGMEVTISAWKDSHPRGGKRA